MIIIEEKKTVHKHTEKQIQKNKQDFFYNVCNCASPERGGWQKFKTTLLENNNKKKIA